jgi:hypothetical protein
LKNVLHPDEFKYYEDAGLREQLAASPNGEAIAKWMQEKGPRVEVRTLHANTETPEGKRYFELMHELDTKWPRWNDPNFDLPPEAKKLFDERLVLREKLTGGDPFRSFTNLETQMIRHCF